MTPLLLTPGPLTTSRRTREALLDDHGSRDATFVAMANEVRRRLVALVAEEPAYTCVPVQGSGTFAVEAMIGTLVPRDGGVCVLVNGAYGARIAAIAKVAGRRCVAVTMEEGAEVDLPRIDAALAGDTGLTHLAVVWSETTTGQLNPLAALAEVAASRGRHLLVDAMSAFGALPLDARLVPFQAVAASANKCLEGVPGLAFVVARRDAIAASAGNAHSLSLDLHDQWRRLEQDGQYRFTPPTHVLAALHSAMEQHVAEGGVAGRLARYRANLAVLVTGMRALGFETLLPDDRQGPIIVTFHAPADPRWRFEAFYEALRERGFAIYPGKLTEAPTFRVGCIGQVFPDDLRRFVAVVGVVLDEAGVTSGAPAGAE